MRDNLMQEKHNGGLAENVGVDKILRELKHFYSWPKMRKNVQKNVRKCRLC